MADEAKKEIPVQSGRLDPATGRVIIKRDAIAPREDSRPVVTLEQVIMRPQTIPTRDQCDEVVIKPISMDAVVGIARMFGGMDKIVNAADMEPAQLLEVIAILVNQDIEEESNYVTGRQMGKIIDASRLNQVHAVVDAMIHPLLASALEKLQGMGAGASAGVAPHSERPN